MSKLDEASVAKLIAHQTGIEFTGRKFDLGGWGQVDDYASLKTDHYLFLEVETGQKHPCTNVLKVWPYLEANQQVTVLLVQVFFPDSPGCNSSRGKLGCWLGQRLEMLLGNRFRYRRLIVAPDSIQILEGAEELRRSLAGFISGDFMSAAL